MARPAKFTLTELLDGARDAVLQYGLDATVAQVSAVVGAPSGSLYHRFPSRQHLMVELWLRSVRRFHQGYLVAAAEPDPHQAVSACAAFIPRYCRAFPADARAMMLFRHSELSTTAPESLRTEVRTVNDEVWAALHRLTQRRFDGAADSKRVALMRAAVNQAAYGLVRPYVGGSVPQQLDDIVVGAAVGILALGDERPAR